MDEQDIVVTEAMIEAGVHVLEGFYDVTSSDHLVVSIFREMVSQAGYLGHLDKQALARQDESC